MAGRLRESWKTSGLIKGTGIPAPTGHHAVGCVDLMHKLEGDGDGLLVRLFYPAASLSPQGAAAESHQYAKWAPHKRYYKGFMEFNKTKMSGLLSGLVNLFMDPRIPALDGARLHHSATKEPTPSSTVADTDKPDEPVHPETTDNGAGEDGGRTDGPTAGTGAQQSAAHTESKFPVVVFSHGLGAMRTVYSGVCCDLASHGYVVAAVEHRDRSACVTLKRVPKPGGPDGQLVDEWLEFYHRPESEEEYPLRNRQVNQRASESSKALDLLYLLNDGGDVQNMLEGGGDVDFVQFKGRLDVSTAAVMGHSFGGATTIQALSQDARFLCGIGLDTWMIPVDKDIVNVTGIDQPLLFINSFDFQWKENIKKMMKLVKPPDERGVSQCSVITLKDSNHYNQADVLYVMPVSTKMSSRIAPQLAYELNQELCHSFLKRHLLKDPAWQDGIPNLDGGEGCSEYVIHGTNVDTSEKRADNQEQSQTEVGDAAALGEGERSMEGEGQEKSEAGQATAEDGEGGSGDTGKENVGADETTENSDVNNTGHSQ